MVTAETARSANTLIVKTLPSDKLVPRLREVGLAVLGHDGPLPSELARFATSFAARVGARINMTGEGLSNAFDGALGTILPTPANPTVDSGRLAAIRGHFEDFAAAVTSDPAVLDSAQRAHNESVARQRRFCAALGRPPFDFDNE